MRKRRKNRVILVGTLVAGMALLVVAGLYIHDEIGRLPQSDPNTKESAASTTASTAAGAAGTAGWSSYTDAHIGISFQYPSGWGVPASETSNAGTQISFGTRNFALWDYQISTLGTGMTFESFVEGQEALSDVIPSTIRVSGETATEITYSDQPGSIDVLVPDAAGNVIDIKRFNDGNPDHDADDSDFNAIVQSVRIFPPGQAP